MSSTNHTSHYNLSQYIGSDKPTYLVDYNSDMAAIDSGIYAAKNEADNNATSIGTLSSLTTTEKSNLVGAINEVDGDVNTLSGTVGQHTTDIASNTSAIGNLANLNTTAKNNLVAAVNEVNTISETAQENISKLNLTSFIGYNGTQMSCSNGTVESYSNITVATNSDGSVGKIYGSLFVSTSVASLITVTLTGTNLRPTSEITINNCGLTIYGTSGLIGEDMIISTNGNITFQIYNVPNTTNRHTFIPCLYFMKDFGDAPQQ